MMRTSSYRWFCRLFDSTNRYCGHFIYDRFVNIRLKWQNVSVEYDKKEFNPKHREFLALCAIALVSVSRVFDRGEKVKTTSRSRLVVNMMEED
jgi:hypothetical protein